MYPVNELIQTIISGYDPDRIYLFGSFARGEQKTGSDIDLLIIKRTDIRPRDRAIAVQSLFVPYTYPLDVLVYTPDEFDEWKNRINSIAYFVHKEGKVIYEKSIH